MCNNLFELRRREESYLKFFFLHRRKNPQTTRSAERIPAKQKLGPSTDLDQAQSGVRTDQPPQAAKRKLGRPPSRASGGPLLLAGTRTKKRKVAAILPSPRKRLTKSNRHIEMHQEAIKRNEKAGPGEVVRSGIPRKAPKTMPKPKKQADFQNSSSPRP